MSTTIKGRLLRTGVGLSIFIPIFILAVVAPIILLGIVFIPLIVGLAWNLGSLLLGDWRKL